MVSLLIEVPHSKVKGSEVKVYQGGAHAAVRVAATAPKLKQ